FDGTVSRPGKSYEDAPELVRESRGAYLYRSRCSSCHQGVGDGDNPLGPDLAGVTERRERTWLERWLAEPDVMLEEGDVIALELFRQYDEIVMPNLRLNEEDVAALIDFMEAESRLASQRALQPAEDSAAGHAAHHAHANHHDHAQQRGVSGIP
ncbi:MAG: cytochrome c, partial [Myxococcota bacterium]